MAPTKIVLIGHVCIDHNKSENATYDGWGSSVLYMSQYYQNHTAAAPCVVSSYGPDMLKYLPSVPLLPAKPNQPVTLVYENDSTTGKRTQKCHNLAAAVPPELTSEVMARIQEADIIIVAPLLPNYSADYLRRVMAAARPDSLKVLCPQGYFRSVTPEGQVQPRDFAEAANVLPLFDLVMYSEEDYPQAMELARKWQQTADIAVIVTQGQNGATVVHAHHMEHIPTTPIPLADIVDSVGCGDVFAATVTIEYYRTRDLAASIRAAHKTAAAKLKAVITVQ